MQRIARPLRILAAVLAVGGVLLETGPITAIVTAFVLLSIRTLWLRD